MAYYICTYSDYVDLPSVLYTGNSSGFERKNSDGTKFIINTEGTPGVGELDWMTGSETSYTKPNIKIERDKTEWITPPNNVTTILVSFANSPTGAVDNVDDPEGKYWNNYDHPEGSLTNLIDVENNSTVVDMDVTNIVSGSDTNGRDPVDGINPTMAWKSFINSNTGGVGTIAFTGIESNASVSVQVASARSTGATDRVGLFSIDGGTTTKTLDGALDPPQTITLNGTTDGSGNLTLTADLAPDSIYVYVNWVKLVITL